MDDLKRLSKMHLIHLEQLSKMHLIQEPDDVAGIEAEARDSIGCLG